MISHRVRLWWQSQICRISKITLFLTIFLSGFHKITEIVDLRKNFSEKLNSILVVVDDLLVHPHAWVRESSSQLISTILLDQNDENLANTMPDYWTEDKAKNLTLKAICQLKCKFVERDHMGECKQLLVYFFKMFRKRFDKPRADDDLTKTELQWLIQKLNGLAAEENSDR